MTTLGTSRAGRTDPRLASAAVAVPAYLVVRGIGVAVLAVFGAVHGRPIGSLLSKWDGEWMLAIAEYGYRGVPETLTDAQGIHSDVTAYAFFPGFPGIVRAVSALPGISTFGAAVAVNVVAGMIAAAGIARLGMLAVQRMPGAYDPQRAGLILVILFAAGPMSVVLNMTYTEALFCALAAWALVGVLEHRWLLAGSAALLIGLVRPTGVAVIAVVMVTAALAHRDGPRAWAAVVLAPLGYLGYLWYVAAQTGSVTGWFTVQSQGWDTQLDYGAAAWRFVTDSLTSAQDFASIATTLVILATLGLLVWSLAARVPWPVLTYGALVTASILLSSGLMMSRARLLLPAFVLLIPVAALLSRQRTAVAASVLVPVVLVSAWFGAYMLTVFQFAI